MQRWTSSTHGGLVLPAVFGPLLVLIAGGGWVVGWPSWGFGVWFGVFIVNAAAWVASVEHRGWALTVDGDALHVIRRGLRERPVWSVPLSAIGHVDERRGQIVVLTPDGERSIAWGQGATEVVGALQALAAAAPSLAAPIAPPRAARSVGDALAVVGVLVIAISAGVPAGIEAWQLVELLRSDAAPVVDLGAAELPRGWVTVRGGCVDPELFETFEVAERRTDGEAPSIDVFHLGILTTPAGGTVRAVVSLFDPDDLGSLACGGPDARLWVPVDGQRPREHAVARRLLSKKRLLLEARGLARSDDDAVFVLERDAQPAVRRLADGAFLFVLGGLIALAACGGVAVAGQRRRAAWSLGAGHVR